MSEPTRAPESLYPRLEPLLATVSRPIQYIGGEVNSRPKAWESAEVRWALLYPDAYALGQPNQGLAILYEVLNERDWILAERSYSVWPDLAEKMRAAGVPQFTLEQHRPLAAFDVIGVSLSTELGYTNLLAALDLAGLPLRSAERSDADAIVLVGGHCAANPEPLAEFVDAVVLGDGEEAVLRVSEELRAWKASGRPGGRAGLLHALATRAGCYVPAFYDVDYAADGRVAAIRPNRPGVPARVEKHTLQHLDAWPYPKAPLVPLAETVHERYSVEIFRGCTRGCRFCQAGMITRPVRERDVETIGRMIETGLAATGLEEVGLLSLSSADHTEIATIAGELAARYAGSNVSLSLPSTRVDAFNIDLAERLSRNGRRSGLTFAPEGGSERLRRVINKGVGEEDLIRTVAAAYASGWRQVKLYFMCGLPTETDEDVLGIAALAARVIEAGRAASGHRDITCTVSIGGFVPKPHTPFQWAAQADAATVDRRLTLLRDAVRADRRYGRSIRVRYADGGPGQVEGLLARGDRRVGRVIEEAFRRGAVFDGWSEHVDQARWQDAAASGLAGAGVDQAWYTTRERARDEVLPWSHLDYGLDEAWLWGEWQDALADGVRPDCRWDGCYDCGVCTTLGAETQIGPTGRHLLPLAGPPAGGAR